jgi:hypothetical protein
MDEDNARARLDAMIDIDHCVLPPSDEADLCEFQTSTTEH